MTDHPNDRAHTLSEDRVRQLAYSIWEAEGQPDGRDADHWARARQILATAGEDGAIARLSPDQDRFVRQAVQIPS